MGLRANAKQDRQRRGMRWRSCVGELLRLLYRARQAIVVICTHPLQQPGTILQRNILWFESKHGSLYPSGWGASVRKVTYAACTASIFASICHWKEPRHLGKRACLSTFNPPFQ